MLKQTADQKRNPLQPSAHQPSAHQPSAHQTNESVRLFILRVQPTQFDLAWHATLEDEHQPQLEFNSPLELARYLADLKPEINGEGEVLRFSAIHFQGNFIRQLSCYTLLSG